MNRSAHRYKSAPKKWEVIYKITRSKDNNIITKIMIMFSIEPCDLNDNFAQAVFKLSNEAWDGSEMARMPFISVSIKHAG